MQGFVRLIFFLYLVFLTVLLLVADPMRLLGMRGNAIGFVQSMVPVAHLVSFWGLTMLALIVRWPIPRWSIVLFLVLYAGITEVLQSCLPPRQSEWSDWFQDIGGIALGIAVCWVSALVMGTCTGKRMRPRITGGPRVAGEWEAVRNVMSRPPIRNETWWK